MINIAYFKAFCGRQRQETAICFYPYKHHTLALHWLLLFAYMLERFLFYEVIPQPIISHIFALCFWCIIFCSLIYSTSPKHFSIPSSILITVFGIISISLTLNVLRNDGNSTAFYAIPNSHFQTSMSGQALHYGLLSAHLFWHNLHIIKACEDLSIQHHTQFVKCVIILSVLPADWTDIKYLQGRYSKIIGNL